ncbi:hypothetical protein NWP22_14875 [Anabaenopsis tanganyikae CS-531]|uniref:Uncharacterized protein n=2 Tax=Anabaenopsis TaxID=110103 RepID=A0ABT5AP38_9CYAN|nr:MULTISPECIES: hypothetical protein [Anabaenopsis]MDB9539089.1 hypothetical protein [Anabaenopsis arnoldii]MDH6091377.1 hypothetical protein [Anabaenopsis arnoldii]MDH6099087.1 hypothetical protein [Anabaenopsis sp. FSS-46]MDH6107129.1 hypothetical protein [Anabaenopsis tanganyikae CS-531]
MLELINLCIRGIQPLLIPICFVTAWTVIILFAWSLWSAARDSVTTAKQMHQIPCPSCQFFTNNYRLKCTVHPSTASTEEAIDCSDYQPKTNPMLY